MQPMHPLTDADPSGPFSQFIMLRVSFSQYGKFYASPTCIITSGEINAVRDASRSVFSSAGPGSPFSCA